MPKQRSFLLSLLLCGCYAAFSQSADFDSLLEKQRLADPQEKIYVHFDKNYYNPGETIWFKAYIFSGIDLSYFSKNFYAELIDENGNVISQRTAPISGSSAASHFDIDSAFTKSTVYFRAYTTAMLNSDTTFFYTRAIRILTPVAAVARAVKVQPPVIHFMPEGGDWLAGVPANMAFIATSFKGDPLYVTGTIKDNSGNTVTDFTTLHNGMGRFSILPVSGKTYTATWKDESGKTYTTPLPPVKGQGVSLKVTDVNGGKRFVVERTEGVGNAQKKLEVIGYMNQKPVYKASVNLGIRTAASGVFPTTDVPSGILQITVFDSTYQPLAERIVFVNNHDYEFDADVFISNKKTTPRGLNAVEVVMSDTMPANLSLSITDADLNEPAPYDNNIVSQMLLAGDLRGHIANPYYYFFSTSDSAAIHLDLVMLTHGWRRYNWSNVLAGKTTPPRWKESNYLSLNGKIAGISPGSFSPDLQLVGILQTSDSAKNFITLPVDRQGKVFTEGLIFFNNAKLYFNFNKKNMSFDKGMLTVDNGLRRGYNYAMLDSMLVKKGTPDIDPVTIANNVKVNSRSLTAGRQFYLKSHELGNVTVTAKQKTPLEKMEETYVGAMFSGDARGKFDLVNDPSAAAYQSVFQYLQGKVAGLQITMGTEPTLTWRGGTPSLYLNEMRTEASVISSTPMSDVAYIKVFSPGDAGSFLLGGSGAIVIYTRRGNDVVPDPNAKTLSYVQLTGYSPIKEFYSPNYATASERDAYDDVRSTLYWNPYILLDKSRKRLRLQFYNNDVTKRFRLVMEGVNLDGKLFHVEKEVQ